MCPSEIRWPIACSIATASSHETRGNPRPSMPAFIEHRRQPALGEPAVVAVRRGRLGVQAAGEDDAGDLLLEEEVDVVLLRHAADGLGAQHRGVALLRERPRDHLREGREDRVLELRQDESDEARALAAQLGRPLVAQDVERGQDGLPGRFGHTGLPVEDAADRRFADADLARDVRQSFRHAAILRTSTQVDAQKFLQRRARRRSGTRDRSDACDHVRRW